MVVQCIGRCFPSLFIRTVVRAVGVVLALALLTTRPVPLLAQEASPAAASAQNTAAPTAAQTGKNPRELQEVVVTAQFKKESVQTTPISITVINAEQLAQQGAQNIMDIAQQTPNVTMRQASTGEGRSNQAFIRGIGQGDFLFTYSPRIAFYVDDVYFSTVQGSIFDLMDVSNVQVLRGPQGTLFGRNAAGGAILLNSQDPKGDDSGYISMSGGSDRYYAVRGAFDESLVPDRLMIRVSAGWHKQDGWVRLVNFKCANPSVAGLLPGITGENDVSNTSGSCDVGTLGGTNVFSGRIKLRWIITEKFENMVNLDYTDDNSQTSADSLTAPPWYTSVNPSTGANSNVPPALTGNGFANWFNSIGGPAYMMPLGGGTVPCFKAAPGPPGTPPIASPCSLPSQALQTALYPNNPYVSYADMGNPGLGRPPNPATGDPGAQLYDPPISTLRQWGASDVLQGNVWDGINLKLITAYREYQGQFGASQASMPVPVQEAFQGVTHHQFSAELHLTGTAFNNLLDWALGGFYLDTHERNYGRVQFEGFAVAGMPFVQDFQINDPAGVQNTSEFLHTIWHLTDKLDLEAGIRHSHEILDYGFYRNYYYFFGIPTSFADFQQATSVDTNRNNPRVSINYKLTPDLSLYAAYATGFTAGAINGRPFVKSDVFGFGPEDVKSFEVGAKTEWMDHRLRVNGDVFYMEYNNIQTTLFGCPTCRSTSPFYVDNGGDARIKGVELEAQARPVDGLLLTAAFGYADFYYVTINPQANPTNDPLGLTLNSPNFGVPTEEISGSAQYSIHLGDAGTLTPHLDFHYQSASYFDTARLNPYTQQDAYAIFNAALTWMPQSAKWQVMLNVTNLTNKLYYYSKIDTRNSFGYASGAVGQPLEWYATFQKSF
ncbi:MAG TPA: TonB-dependent receptor [Steroidobacteraceae bacterium]|nr:TonB-dependent receptor [Steroidobacteraceae bacterium]